MNDFFCFGISMSWWDAVLTVFLIVVLPWRLYRYCWVSAFFFVAFSIPIARIVHLGRIDITRFNEIEEGLSRKIGKECVLERVIGGDEDSTLTAFARTGDSFLEFPIKVVRLKRRTEYIVSTAPTKVMPFKWCVRENVHSREELLEVIRKNDTYKGDIPCDKLNAYNGEILSLPGGPGCTAVAFPNGFHSYVAMLGERDAGHLVESVNHKEFDWHYIMERFLGAR